MSEIYEDEFAKYFAELEDRFSKGENGKAGTYAQKFESIINEQRPTGLLEFDGDGNIQPVEFQSGIPEQYEVEFSGVLEKIPFLKRVLLDMLNRVEPKSDDILDPPDTKGLKEDWNEVGSSLLEISVQLHREAPDLAKLVEHAHRLGSIHQRMLLRKVVFAVLARAEFLNNTKEARDERYGSKEKRAERDIKLRDEVLELVKGGMKKTVAYKKVAKDKKVKISMVRRAMKIGRDGQEQVTYDPDGQRNSP
jgi:hypothetical protein